MDNTVGKILEFNKLAQKLVKKYPFKRSLFYELYDNSARAFKAILGPRGVGKTILLQQLCYQGENSIYISADTIPPDVDLFEVIKKLQLDYNYQTFYIDEIHFNKGYEQAIKNIFDFLDVRLFFTSSVSLSLIDASTDLSRRVALYELNILPFEEFLLLKGKTGVKSITLESLINQNYDKKLHRLEIFFEEYLQGGALPYSLLGGDVIESQKNILTTIIEKDIPCTANITTEDIFQLKKTVEFVAESSPDGVNYSSISSNLGVTKYKAQQYVDLLYRAFILNVSFPYGANVSREPKILMYLPNRLIFDSYDKCIGGLREDFATTMFRSLKLEYFYLKTTRGKKTPDFFFIHNEKKIVCEIGGKGKGRQQFKGLNNHDIKLVFRHGSLLKENDLPLFMLSLVK